MDATQLYAFHNKPTPPLNASDKPGQAGWQIYDFKREFARQGIGSRTKAWRFTDVNAQYTVSVPPGRPVHSSSLDHLFDLHSSVPPTRP